MALSDKDLAEIKPGCLVRLCQERLWVWNLSWSIFTIKSLNSSDLNYGGGAKILTLEELTFWVFPGEISLVAPSLESVPIEDWAGLAHFLHPKLKARVEKWLKSVN